MKKFSYIYFIKMLLVAITVTIIVIIVILIIIYLLNNRYEKLIDENTKENSLLITFDELVNWKYIPEFIKKDLKGYQAFKALSIEFTNIQNNRQDCSPCRSSFFTSEINHGINDDISELYQSDSISRVSPIYDTLGKIYKRNDYDNTAFYGKSHMDANLSNKLRTLPVFNINTRKSMNVYGYDIYNMFGDTANLLGVVGDIREFESIIPPNYSEYDFKDGNRKLTGILPFLKARKKDGKSFHAQYHMANPHDTMQLYQNTSTEPVINMAQFKYPFHIEQMSEFAPGEWNHRKNPFVYNEEFRDAWVDNPVLVKNFFESDYESYKNDYKTLPFINEYYEDYVTEPLKNSVIPVFAGSNAGMAPIFSIADDKTDIKSWKNLVNNYYGLVLDADRYLYEIYLYLKNNDMLKNTSVIITSDHGDQIGSHGLKQKGFPFKESVNIPMMVYSPKLNSKFRGTQNDTLSSLLDLNPTFEVMSNLEMKSTKFKGNSLLDWFNGELVPININNDVFHISNSTMHLEIAYFGYLLWKSDEKSSEYKVLFEPKNIFDFQYSFMMSTAKINGKQYKFCKFYSLIQLLEENFKDRVIKSENLMIQNPLLPSEFTFNEGLNIVYSESGEGDSVFLFEFMYNMFLYIKSIRHNVFILPGIEDTYETAKSKNMFICWNTTDDSYELNNLCDLNYPERSDIYLFEQLNEILKNETIKFGGKNFLYASPLHKIASLYDSFKELQTDLTREAIVSILKKGGPNLFD